MYEHKDDDIVFGGLDMGTRAALYLLIKELADRRFSLCFEDGRLALVNEETGVSLCTCASMGHSFASLMARFGKPNVAADTGRLIQRAYAS